MSKRVLGLVGLTVAATIALTGCVAGSDTTTQPNTQSGALPGSDGCTPIVVATSSEKVNLMDALGAEFKKSSQASSLGECATVWPINVSSGTGANILTENPTTWPEFAPEWYPTIYSPASSVWVDQINSRPTNNGLLSDPVYFGHTPVVFGVPETMAKALGYPEKEIGYKDIESYIADPNGWATLGKPSWGSFKIAKTNPNTSTTGLSVILTQAYAASGKTDGLTVEDIAAAEDFSRTFESGAIHYGDTTGKVLTTLYNNSKNGTNGSGYVSAIALEETSLFWYNQGNPDSHTVAPGEQLVPPAEKLVAVYPTEGSMWSDNPAVVLSSPWVTAAQKTASAAFLEFLNTKPAQEILPQYGFRPLDESVDVSPYLNETVGIDPSKPSVTLPKPSAEVVSAAKDQWKQIRKGSAVLQVIDVSGSMNDPAGNGLTKLDGALQASVATLGNFRATDEVGIWTFTTNPAPPTNSDVTTVIREFGPLNGDKESTQTAVEDIKYTNDEFRQGTPMYDALDFAYDYMVDEADPSRITAIILLSDGQDMDSNKSLDSLLIKLNSKTEGGSSSPVRIFTIAYGDGADASVLKQISAASGGQFFDATDPTKIQAVFQSVINNF